MSKIKLVYCGRFKPNPYSTRNDVSVASINDLVQSIRLNGQDDPVEAYRDDDGKLVIVDGHRRVLACAG